jgi:hypothetical protein
MQTKLTLRINDRVKKKAKAYAQRHNTSLSKMVEDHLEEVTQKEWKLKTLDELSPIVKSLMGIIKGAKDLDWKKAKEDYLYKKYVK